jgi:predicted TIM-barrel fold metal-dependent hydrolase
MTVTETEDITGLGYLFMDADQHSTGAPDIYERYIDPDKADMAIKVEIIDGKRVQTFNGRPKKYTARNFQVVANDEILGDMGVEGAGMDQQDSDGTHRPMVIPGSLLTRLNPLKDLDDDGRREFVRKYRELSEHLDNPEDRLTVMDTQGLQACVNYLTLPGTEPEFEGDLDGLYANLNAMNRWIGEVWQYNYKDRLFNPPYVSFADPDAALDQLDRIMKIQVPKAIQCATGPSMGTSPFRPENDRFWSICNEAGIKLTTHLGSLTRYAAHGEEWSEEEVMLGDMDALQWVFYYGDRPAFETVGAAIMQGWFEQFPNMMLLVAEQGTVWLPYLLRKMDHAFQMGRPASFGRKWTERPRDTFNRHCIVAPFPEENVERVVKETRSADSICFASDFPHGEGLPEPSMFANAVVNLPEDQQRKILRGNIARYLDLDD